MSLKNSPFEHDQAKQLEDSQARDSDMKTISTHQRGTATSGQQIWFSIPLECSSGNRTLRSSLEEGQQHQDQPRCTFRLLSQVGKPSGHSGRSAPSSPSQDHWHRMFGRLVQVGSSGSNPTGGGE